ncbi:LacI family transcriptional regulator [Lacticaseibacillus paracasei]|uniref:LacI family DNA-binding transcriptional regulator n=1 Tax=Lacticaseibacillus paracasei TaxID=1597 RepID=UPI001C43BC48|nr:LacI family DNA-binding transcriptional regulator [Lacticaseibacillus paracasei]QXJ69380.1 LacI family transcriptional regulator [Lacticaseibacillus paracasei subsp. paracasei]
MMNSKSQANIKDVAALAMVSTATVSRYLNGNLKRMSTATATRVKAAIEKLNYVPNAAARQMITKQSQLIALIVGNTDDYFSTELFKGVSSILEANGYIGTMFDSDSDIVREKHLMETVNSHGFDGLIIQPFSTVSEIKTLMSRDVPIVLADRETPQAPWPQVVTNNFDAAKQATAYFVRQGFTHFIVLTSELAVATNRRERYRGIKAAAQNVDVLEVSESSYNHKRIHKQLIELLMKDTERTVIFSLKERWLLEFIPNLVLEGYVDNIKATATAFADTETARRIEPKLKLISQDPFLLGASAGEVMVNDLTGHSDRNQAVIVVPAKFG